MKYGAHHNEVKAGGSREREYMWGRGGLKERKALASNYYLSLRGKYIESCQSTEAAIAKL